MAKNAKVADDDTEVSEDMVSELKKAKDDVETSQEADEPTEAEESEDESEETSEEEGKTDDSQEEETEDSESESDEESSEFVKEFPNIKGDTLEDYTRELERTLQLSNTEGKRLSDELKKKSDTEEPEIDISDPVSLFMKQKMDEEITQAFTDFSKHFPQVTDANEYNKFTQEVSTLSQTILNSQKRLASPKELYSKAAVILGWEPQDSVSGKDKLNVALKDKAAISKTSSATKKSSKSKVTDQMIAFNRMIYPNKSDAEIREELEPYVK